MSTRDRAKQSERVWFVTGASSGFGKAIGRAVLDRGQRLVAATREPRAVEDLVDQDPERAVALALDVTDEAASRAAFADAVARFGRVDVVVNNAGVALAGDVEDLAYADMDWIMSIDFWGVVHGSKEFLPHLVASGDGHLVNMSSLFGLISIPGQSMYNAAKYAVRGFSEALREELLMAGHPVGVTVVHPGGIKTAIARNARTSTREDHDRNARYFDQKLAKMEPEDAARIIVEKGILGGKARLLVGLDAHALHHLARLTGSRYQDLVASVAKRTKPPKR
jgi:NADP-dependent 3-hydroxy acid dehydrogenase YdfG